LDELQESQAHCQECHEYAVDHFLSRSRIVCVELHNCFRGRCLNRITVSQVGPRDRFISGIERLGARSSLRMQRTVPLTLVGVFIVQVVVNAPLLDQRDPCRLCPMPKGNLLPSTPRWMWFPCAPATKGTPAGCAPFPKASLRNLLPSTPRWIWFPCAPHPRRNPFVYVFAAQPQRRRAARGF